MTKYTYNPEKTIMNDLHPQNRSEMDKWTTLCHDRTQLKNKYQIESNLKKAHLANLDKN